MDYLGVCEGKNQSKNVLNNLHHIWYDKKYKDKKRCGMMCTVLRSNMLRIFSMIFMTVVIFGLEFGGVFLIKAIINHFNGESFYDLPLYVIGIMFLGLKIISIFLSRQNQILQVR